MGSRLRSLLFGGTRGLPLEVSLGLLAIRLITGLALCTVFEKVLPRDGRWGPQDWFIRDVAQMGFPCPVLFAWLAALSEFVGGILLAAGCLARPAAFLNCATTFVAASVFHRGDISGQGLLATVFCGITLGLTVAGPGGLSLDRYLAVRTSNSAVG